MSEPYITAEKYALVDEFEALVEQERWAEAIETADQVAGYDEDLACDLIVDVPYLVQCKYGLIDQR